MASDGGHLKSGQLTTVDVTASTVANIGPGIDFYFAFGAIAVTAGVAAPLPILAACVAVVLLAYMVAEFTKAEPSAGSFITYVETALGARAGVATARCRRPHPQPPPVSAHHGETRGPRPKKSENAAIERIPPGHPRAPRQPRPYRVKARHRGLTGSWPLWQSRRH